jgi:hypothetical protein
VTFLLQTAPFKKHKRHMRYCRVVITVACYASVSVQTETGSLMRANCLILDMVPTHMHAAWGQLR